MAACFDLLLRVFYGFLFLLFHLYVSSRHEIVPNDLTYDRGYSFERNCVLRRWESETLK